MTAPDWARVGEFFAQAIDLEEGQRDAFLDAIEDEALRSEVRSLVEAHARAGPLDAGADAGSMERFGHVFRLEAGERLGDYEIIREIATGGMATVYLAADEKHGREVAVKVLRPELAMLLGPDRFIREMRTTAGLQHPHILPLFDSGRSDGLLFYVMPFVEGETLRQKLAREGQLGVEESVRIATEVAHALGYAHRQGVVHRDVKPENILLQDGQAMVADFGIAVAVSAAAGERHTEAGLSLGTPHYMSPEQTTADRDLTARSDIYSLGAVLYEMLTGDPPHTGASPTQILRRIVTEDARPVREVRKTVPPNVEAALSKALELLPADRFERAGDFARALADPSYRRGPRQADDHDARGWPRSAVVSVGGMAAVSALIVAGALLGWFGGGSNRANSPVIELVLDPPDSTMSFGVELALSPDGRRVVAEVVTDEGRTLYQRLLDSREWQLIPGTEGGFDPFFSPDGEWLGFISGPKAALQKIRMSDGAISDVLEIQDVDAFEWGIGASWGTDGRIAVTTNSRPYLGEQYEGIVRVPEHGGDVEQLTVRDRERGEIFHFDPLVWPHGHALIYTSVQEPFRPYIGAAALAEERDTVFHLGMSPGTDGRGRLTWVSEAGTLFAQRFDAATLTLSGERHVLAEGVQRMGATAGYAISPSGSVAYLSSEGADNTLIVLDRSGRRVWAHEIAPGFTMRSPRFSPSGNEIAFVRSVGTDHRNAEIWVYSHLERASRRLSFEGVVDDPTWSLDGSAVAYALITDTAFTSFVIRSVDGRGAAQPLLLAQDDHIWQPIFVPGSEDLVFVKTDGIHRLPPDRIEPEPVYDPGFMVSNHTFSPDGRWMAYLSLGGGAGQLWIRSYPDMGAPVSLADHGAGFPAWSPRGDEIFYLTETDLVSARVETTDHGIRVVGRDTLFRTDHFAQYLSRTYDVHPDGEHFVFVGGAKAQLIWRVNALGAPEVP